MRNEVLIRLRDINNEFNYINAFHTENPCEFLKMYTFCKKEEMPIYAKDKEEKELMGIIEDIEVHFGGGDNLSCIDVWIELLG